MRRHHIPRAGRRKQILSSKTNNTGAAPADAISAQAGQSLGEHEFALNGSVAKDPFRAFVAKGAIHQDL
jgi:hypothetical protein